jgi:Protein of unknown function (DUF1579)
MTKLLARGSLLSATLSASLAVTPVMAEDKPAGDAAGPPKPAPELAAFMKDLVGGTWTCTTTFAPGAFGPGSPEVKATNTKVKMTKDPALDGFFYRGEYSVPKSKTVPMAFAGVFFLGYEPGTKQITNVSMDNTGAVYMGTGPLTEKTASWNAEGYMMGTKVKVRETMTKVGPKEVTHKFEVDMGKGYQPMGEDVCKR